MEDRESKGVHVGVGEAGMTRRAKVDVCACVGACVCDTDTSQLHVTGCPHALTNCPSEYRIRLGGAREGAEKWV